MNAKRPLKIGEQINFWTLIGPTDQRTNDNRPMWLARCRCGTVRAIARNCLLKRRVVNCGCVRGSKAATAMEKIAMQTSAPLPKGSNTQGQSRAHLFPSQYVNVIAVKRSKLCADIPERQFKPLANLDRWHLQRRLAEMVR